jgi:hypothetical protein
MPQADFRSLGFSGNWFEILERQESTPRGLSERTRVKGRGKSPVNYNRMAEKGSGAAIEAESA